ncbi:phosphotransferase [Actinoplanes sp. NPDC051513]|uniref:phosphotransferase n=1 Tax=Actinoplanes sp. NPDC051513 TaxID=3363908 RepID=UPI0037AFAA7B
MKANAWHDPRWQSDAHGWITTRLAGLGMPVQGPIQEIRVRPWSVTHQAPTALGPVWFKANTPACAYEAALAEALAKWQPDAVLVPLAVDAERGWMLTADAGKTLREEIAPDELLTVWAEMLRAYATLQRAVAERADDLVALGVPDHRPARLPERLAELLADPGVRNDLGTDRRAAVEEVAPVFREWCAELAADGIPAGLQHDDLTDANVFRTVGGGFRFFDWGDSSVAHPFGSLLVALGFAGYVLGIEAGAPEIRRLRDAYLEVWTDLASPAELRRSVSLACRVTRVSKALAWERALREPSLPVEEDFRHAVADWLAETPKPPLV